MFTGIVEEIAQIIDITGEEANLTFTLKCPLAATFKIDQSIAHNGCCLTVIAVDAKLETYQVTAIQETLNKTNLGSWGKGDLINLERSMLHNGRLDGHIVQGHVDAIAICSEIQNQSGSWKFTFTHSSDQLTVEKGSIAVNGVSLTVVDSKPKEFSVCIIPYTYAHTNFNVLKPGSAVNIEFDILGKYVQQYLKAYGNQ